MAAAICLSLQAAIIYSWKSSGRRWTTASLMPSSKCRKCEEFQIRFRVDTSERAVQNNFSRIFSLDANINIEENREGFVE